MFESTESRRQVGRFAWALAWFGLVIGQLHALSRHATEDGKSDLEIAATRFWAEPAANLLSPLLDWASADAVYVTYGKLWLPVFVAFTLCAFAVRRTRTPYGAEKWAWRIALTGYVAACLAVAAEYWTMWTGINDPVLEGVFIATIPAMLLTVIGSTFLGIVLIRRGVGLPAWILAATFPGLIVIPQFTSLGNIVLPIAFAFGLMGRRLAADRVHSDVAPAEVRVA